MVNAATDGRSVTVMRGLVNFLTRDEELALVVGHELSHNVLGHFERGRAGMRQQCRALIMLLEEFVAMPGKGPVSGHMLAFEALAQILEFVPDKIGLGEIKRHYCNTLLQHRS